jgi:large subunit ribosomal protein L13
MSRIYKIDATDRKLGRLATEIASILHGKNNPDFLPYKLSDNKVIVFNTAKIKVTGKKFEDKKYYHYSGYPGGIKETNFKTLFERDPNEPLRRAVFGMLPKNKLRDKMLKNLKLYAREEETRSKGKAKANG